MTFDAADLGAVGSALACPAATAEQILRQGRIRLYAERSHILRQGDRSGIAVLVVLGRAHALLYGPDGQTILLYEYGPGELFGGLAPDVGLEEADVVAIEAVRALLLEAGALAVLAERHGCIGLALSRLLLRRLRATSERMYERAALSAPGRVCAELLRRARQGEGMTIRPVPVISELALRVGTTRETASRTVSGLERRGILRRDGEALVVAAPRRLEEEIL